MLKPDFLLKQGKQAWVLDTKWKLIDESLGDSREKYGLSQSDFYQLFAYGERYLDAEGEMFLVYPMTSKFRVPLQVFDYSTELRLWVVPFDLDQGLLVCDRIPSRAENKAA